MLDIGTSSARRGWLLKGGILALGLLLCALVWIGASGSAQAQVNDTSLRPGAVFAMTNDPTNNEVTAYQRDADGLLTPAGTFATGGQGSGVFEQSANGLILGEQSPNNLNGGYRFLFATNAGSNTISVFRVGPDGLTLVDQQQSGGTHPISVTVRKNVLYVLNGGNVQCTGGRENITGFNVGSGGKLTPIPGSTRPLSGQSTGCAQVSFNPSGSVLAVTERNADNIDTFTVDNKGIATGPTPNDNAESGGSGPFGFTYTQRDQLLVAESSGGAPGQGGLASFDVDKQTGTLKVAGTNTRNGQSDTCWVVNTDNGKFAFVTNFITGNISSYRVDSDGSLTLLDPNAGNTGGTGASDQALSGNSRFLYARNSVQGTISSFRVGDDGSLVPLQVVAAPNPAGAGIGIAAK